MPIDTRSRIVALALVAALSLAARPARGDPEDDPYAHLETFADALVFIQQSYVDELEVDELIHFAIRGMTLDLDLPSTYMSADDYARFRDDTIGRYYGVGIITFADDGAIAIDKVFEDSPADRSGLLAGDRIVAIDGEAVTTENIDQMMNRIKGPRGSLVRLEIRRDELDSPLEIEVARDRIRTPSVEVQRLPRDLAWIRILQFQEKTGREVRRALASLERGDDELRGLVLDLRTNPGGFLDEAAEVADVFLDEGTIVTTRGRAVGETTEVAHQPGTRGNLPVVVLQNGGTASAAEIVAGALQDHGRATIVGTTSFGKGSVQTTYEFSDGSALKLTIARYYTPSGRSIEGTGIDPDLFVENTEEDPDADAPSSADGEPDLSDMPPWVLDDRQMRVAVGELLAQAAGGSGAAPGARGGGETGERP